MANIGMSRKEVILVISDIGQKKSYAQADNHLDYLIWGKRLPNMKRHGLLMQAQSKTMKRSQICVSQYRWHMMIEVEWEDLQQTKLLWDVFTCFFSLLSVEFL